MLVCRGTSILLTRHRPTDSKPHLPYTVSWRESSYSGWRCSASLARQGRRLTHWKRLRGGWMCVEFLSLIFPPDLLRMGLGTTNSQPRQRLHSFCGRILRGHQHLLSAYLSLRASLIPPNIDCVEAIQTIRPSPSEGCVWVTNLLEIKFRNNDAWSQHSDCCMVIV